MNTDDPQSPLPPSVANKLGLIRRRAWRLKLTEGLARTGAALIVAMLAAMLLDLAVGWLEPRARYAVTALALGGVAILCALWCARPLLRGRTIIATAHDVDQSIPQLEERWSTVTELAQNNDATEMRGSEAMIRKVYLEAESAGARIDPASVVSAKPAYTATGWLAGTAAALVLLALADFSQTRVLIHRFWQPGDNVSLTEVNASPADAWVAKGEPLTLNATIKGRVAKMVPRLSIRRASGVVKETAMAAQTSRSDGVFQHSIAEVADSFLYRVRAGDGQTPWHRITAVERPNISAVKLSVTPPDYSYLPKEEKDSIPQGIRVLQGSEIVVAFKSDQALEKMLLAFGNGKSAQLTARKDQWYEYRSRAAESFTFAAVATNKFQLENRNRPSCLVSVYEDLPPSVKIVVPSDEVAVLPDEKVNVTFEAADDFGVAKADVIVTTTKVDGQTDVITLPVALKGDEGKKQIRRSIELDPKALGLKHGDQLTYVVRVTDTKQTPADAKTESQGQAMVASAKVGSNEQASAFGETGREDPPDLVKTSEENGQSSLQESASFQAKAAGQGPEDEVESSDSPSLKEGVAQAPKFSEESGPQSSADPSSLSAKAGNPQQEETPASGNPPPPNEMTKRMLDAGQSASCKACRITIDEWAGTFEGEKRKKLEIAIAPVLEQLARALKTADAKTELLKSAAVSADGLRGKDAEPLALAKKAVAESEGVIAGLKSRTAGTPYAFAGLQLHNIGTAHVTPAHLKLNQISIDAAAVNPSSESIGKASFHIGRAREMLADLTRTFETVKREQKIADAMQKLAKMHQVFIEDTQALLGSSKGSINSFDRKVAEVDDQFVEKLKALLEEKKKVMAELSKLLSEDPRLLRRFLAMQQLECASYRDQMTLLADRQKKVHKQVAAWNGASDKDRAALLPTLREEYASSATRLLQDATTLRENMEVWLPLDVKPDASQIEAALRKSEKVIQLMVQSASTGAATNPAREQALEEMRSLRGDLAGFDQLVSKERVKMTAYIANRMAELESLITTNAGQIVIEKSVAKEDFPKAAEVVQQAITDETIALGQKLEASEKQVARLSDEIADKAAFLNKTIKLDIIPPQDTSVGQLAGGDVASAGELLDRVVPAFAMAEQTFDELLRLIIAKLDESPPPSAPGASPQLDSLLAMLQNEMKACESLGIPCRPLNVAVMSDWMKPSPGAGQGMGRAQARAAQAQAQQAKADAERLEKESREKGRKAGMAALKEGKAPEESQVASQNRGSAWNKLASRLEKDLLQGRDNTPPEQYRAAIDSYFKAISETANPAAK